MVYGDWLKVVGAAVDKQDFCEGLKKLVDEQASSEDIRNYIQNEFTESTLNLDDEDIEWFKKEMCGIGNVLEIIIRGRGANYLCNGSGRG